MPRGEGKRKKKGEGRGRNKMVVAGVSTWVREK
jgi:hypothetical protein